VTQQPSRIILHGDMDAFYASVEQRDNPELRGKAVVVGGRPPRGVVAAASYEARRFGIHSAMAMQKALSRCADLVIISPRMAHYQAVSKRVFAILKSYSPRIEPLSLDEAFVDLTGSQRLFGEPRKVAEAIKTRVREELSLVISVGIGPSKLIAKLASDSGKPDGLVVIAPEQVESFLHPLPVSRLHGVGKVTQRALEQLGIRTVAQLAKYPRSVLVSRLGETQGGNLQAMARGEDPRDVQTDRSAKSIGAEQTFERDYDGAEALLPYIREQAQEVGRRLRAEKLAAKTIVLKLKTADFKVRTRQRSLSRPTCDDAVIAREAERLLHPLLRSLGKPIRLAGVTASNLQADDGPKQLSLDEAD
jgi:DNA polymerase-4